MLSQLEEYITGDGTDAVKGQSKAYDRQNSWKVSPVAATGTLLETEVDERRTTTRVDP